MIIGKKPDSVVDNEQAISSSRIAIALQLAVAAANIIYFFLNAAPEPVYEDYYY